MTHYSEDNGTSARAEAEDETNAIALPFPKLNGGAAAFGADANAFGEENGTLTLQVDENDPSVGLAALQLASSDFEGLPQQQQTLIGGGDLATADLSWSAQMDAAGAAGAAGAGAAHAGGAQREGLGVVATPRAAHQDGQLASTPQSSQLLHRIYLPGSPHHPRGISATPGSHANASGLTMTGSSVLSDSDSLPVFEGSNDGIESRQIFRLLEEGVSEGSNDAWLLSHNPPPPPPQTQSAPGAAGPVLSTPAARRGDAADRSVQDSSAGKSAAPTPFLDASAKDKEAPAPAGEEEEGWSEEQDLMVLMAGKAAAQDPAPSAYEESWKRLNREGSGGLQGRCVRALARRYEVLVSKAINFSRATAGS